MSFLSSSCLSFPCKFVLSSSSSLPFDQPRGRSFLIIRRRRRRGRSFPSVVSSYSYSSAVVVVVCGCGGLLLLLPTDPWSPAVDSQSIASQLFAISLFPYLAFLYYITRSKTAPKLTLFGFYFLLAFVGATIPAGIYAKLKYGTSLANVDWLHGGAESLLTLTNLFIVLGLRGALRKINDSKKDTAKSVSDITEKQSSL